jgi:hypothetical protein
VTRGIKKQFFLYKSRGRNRLGKPKRREKILNWICGEIFEEEL